MKSQPLSRLLLLGMALLVILACGLPSLVAPPPPPQDPGAFHTMAAATIVFALTQGAGETQAAAPPVGQETVQAPVVNTEIPAEAPTATLQPTATLAPTSTPLPTFTPQPTVTPLPTPTETPIVRVPPPVGGGGGVGCINRAQFIKDVTIPDDTVVLPVSSFTKVWQIKNIGTCNWSTGYSIVFSDGERMQGKSTLMHKTVLVGETINMGVDLLAPQKDGRYFAEWLLRDSAGNNFGLGVNNNPLTVQIKVSTPESGLIYNFAANYCSATWRTTYDTLTCPGKEKDEKGFVVQLFGHKQENRKENELAIWTNPSTIKDTYIAGTYPSFVVRNGDRFMADIGCLADYPRCDVIFQLRFRIGDGEEYKLGEWREVYDGEITRVDVDLSSLAGSSVRLILAVWTNGKSEGDAAFWLMPHIRRP